MTRTIADAIEERLQELTAAERKVARSLMADYPRAGLGTAASLAALSGVSPPTVVRFCVAIGLNGFAALQRALRDEVSLSSRGPLGHSNWNLEARPATTNDLTSAAQILASAAIDTARAMPPVDWEDAVTALADTSKLLLTIGGRYTAPLAELLATTLGAVRPNVHSLRDPLGADAGWFVDMAPKTTLVAVDIPRYQTSTIETVRLARRRRATIVLVTDDRLSPAAADAHTVLPVSLQSPSPFAGLTSATALFELLLRDTIDRLGDSARHRLTLWEPLRRRELHVTEDN